MAITSAAPSEKIDFELDADIPHIIKYMGSKRNIIDFVLSGISQVYDGGMVIDLFAGSSILSAALRNKVPVHSNDIQSYSGVLARMYSGTYNWMKYPNLMEVILNEAGRYVEEFKSTYPGLQVDYNTVTSLKEFNRLENKQQKLIHSDFLFSKYHLFVKYYSGTYWSFEQCLWIDALISVADSYHDDTRYAILASLMFAMSYNSQSTGHYAQYRDANTESSMKDILLYRKKDIPSYFRRKLTELMETFGENTLPHKQTTE